MLLPPLTTSPPSSKFDLQYDFPPSLFTLKELLKNQATLSLDAVSSVASNGTFPKREGEKI